jgi:hypothetical protein
MSDAQSSEMLWQRGEIEKAGCLHDFQKSNRRKENLNSEPAPQPRALFVKKLLVYDSSLLI